MTIVPGGEAFSSKVGASSPVAVAEDISCSPGNVDDLRPLRLENHFTVMRSILPSITPSLPSLAKETTESVPGCCTPDRSQSTAAAGFA